VIHRGHFSDELLVVKLTASRHAQLGPAWIAWLTVSAETLTVRLRQDRAVPPLTVLVSEYVSVTCHGLETSSVSLADSCRPLSLPMPCKLLLPVQVTITALHARNLTPAFGLSQRPPFTSTSKLFRSSRRVNQCLVTLRASSEVSQGNIN